MQCSNCRKEIPYRADSCPFCNELMIAEKSAYFVSNAIIMFALGSGLGLIAGIVTWVITQPSLWYAFTAAVIGILVGVTLGYTVFRVRV